MKWPPQCRGAGGGVPEPEEAELCLVGHTRHVTERGGNPGVRGRSGDTSSVESPGEGKRSHIGGFVRRWRSVFNVVAKAEL